MSSYAADDALLGRAKKSDESDGVGPTIPFPVPVLEDLYHVDEETKTRAFNERPTIIARLISSGRALVDDPEQVAYLKKRGFYGYLPFAQLTKPGQMPEAERIYSTDEESEDDAYRSSSPPVARVVTEAIGERLSERFQMILSDVEVLFLLHGLGCLQVILPEQSCSGEENTSICNSLRLWYYICSGASTSEQCIHPTRARMMDEKFLHAELHFLRRYAAYMYYRSRGWIVRPGLAFGGMHFLLYAGGPEWRHAAFGVVVDRTECDGHQLTCASIAAHVRVAHSVGKRLILCRVSLPNMTEYENFPWNAIHQAKVTETLIDHWTPGSKNT